MVKKNFYDMFRRFDRIPACERPTYRQTSCHDIVRTMHTRRAVRNILLAQFDMHHSVSGINFLVSFCHTRDSPSPLHSPSLMPVSVLVHHQPSSLLPSIIPSLYYVSGPPGT